MSGTVKGNSVMTMELPRGHTRGTRRALLVSCAAALCLSANAAAAASAEDCRALKDVALDEETFMNATLVADGAPSNVSDDEMVPDLPPFCRVSGATSPVEGSRIGFEAWLPLENWNGRLRMFGNGGYSSSMAYDRMGEAVAEGYVAVATDTGHQSDDPDFAVGRPETIPDWGHRAVHETVVRAKQATERFYGRPADYAYFDGCSTGGHQALMEAQRYPEDFDGILAGAPGHNRTHLNAGFLWLYLQNHSWGDDAEQIVPAAKLPFVADAVLEQCRAQNGAAAGGLADDPYLNDPLSCDFDPTVLACEDGDDGSCLTEREISALDAMYDGPRNPETGERIYFGWPVGSENAGANPERPGWSNYWADFNDPERPARASFWRVWAFGDPDWSWWNIDFARDIGRIDDRLARDINAMDADLRPFRKAGGKLIQYHGLADPVAPALDSISYYERVSKAAGEGAAEDFYRLFLAPGMEHCRRGPGPNVLDLQPALEAWVERGQAPEHILAARHEDDDPEKPVEFTRSLCPYPQKAFYDGQGDPAEAASFECRDAPRVEFEDLGQGYLR